MERLSIAEWFRYAGIPQPPADLVDEVKRICTLYVLAHGGDPGTHWDVTVPGAHLSVYGDWIYNLRGVEAYGKLPPELRWSTQIVRMCLTRFENDPEVWVGLGMRAWLPLSLIPRIVIDRAGATNVSGEAYVSVIGRERIEFELLHHKAVVGIPGPDLVAALRADAIVLAPNPNKVSNW